jgi:drug/metabolite transporter (DMT)-like permease
LLLVACLFAANHVAARFAMDHGVDVVTAVAVRSLGTAAVVTLIVLAYRVPWAMDARQARSMFLIGILIAVQSVCLYAAVARIPVGVALLAFNTYPLWTALWARLLYRHRPERAVLLAMPLILLGLALALDVPGAIGGGYGVAAAAVQGGAVFGERIGTAGLFIGWAQDPTLSGVAFAVAAAAVFGVALTLTQHEVAAIDGRLRSALTMAQVGLLALAGAAFSGGLSAPTDLPGWAGLATLTVLYGTAFTLMFTLLPRLGVVGNSPILNVEPVAALLLAWALLGQRVGALQWVGAVLVVGAVMGLGLRRR